MKYLKILFTAAFLFCGQQIFSQVLLYKKIQLEGETRVNDLLNRMTLDEKIEFISGVQVNANDRKYDGTKGNEKLDISPFKVFNGSYGVNAMEYLRKNGTYFPVPINMASTWNPALVANSMNALSKEINAAGAQSNLGPSLNIIRDLRGGRSFEYFTEDPFLNGEIAAAYVRGIQSQRNLAVLKHFICNNQERERNFLDVKISERALREIYLPGFKKAINKGGALGVMTSYNKLNGKPIVENEHLLKEILKNEWGFQGLVMTNWGIETNSASKMIQAGVDLEMPTTKMFNKDDIYEAIKKNEITEANISEMVRRILVVTFVTGVVDEYQFENPKLLGDKKNIALARKLAEESMVLLKNKSKILPINAKKAKSIAVIGPNGNYGTHFREGKRTSDMFQGGGISSIEPPINKMITPLQGIRTIAGGSIKYEPGCYGEHGTTEIKSNFFKTPNNKLGLNASYFKNDDFEGTPIKKIDRNINFNWNQSPDVINEKDQLFSVKWQGKIKAPTSRLYTFELQAQGAAKVYINGKLVVNKRRRDAGWDKFAMGTVYLDAGEYSIRVEYKKTTDLCKCKLLWDYGNDEYLKKAVELAKNSKYVIMPLGTSGLIESEKIDRDHKLDGDESLTLSVAQQKLIHEVSKVNSNIIVVTYSAGVICESWKNKVSAIIHAGFPGQEGGYALANILFGKTNPSGRLTVTLPSSIKQYPQHFYTYKNIANYSEGLYVGYRHFEKNNLTPSFPFGHGLSYTNFLYTGLTIEKTSPINNQVVVNLNIKNTGSVAGKEVVQLYVQDVKSSVDRPKKELKAFQKVYLNPGESTTVSFKLDTEAFAYFDVEKNKWSVEPGKFNIKIGSSSKDIKQTGSIIL